MTTRLDAGVTYTQSWDAQNRLGSVAAPARNTAWVYDADGARVSKADGAMTTVDVGGLVIFRLTPDAIGIDGTFSVAKDTLEECFFTDAGGTLPCSADKAVEALISDVSGKSLSSQRYSYFAITPAESASLLSGKHVRIRVWSNSRGSSAMLRLLVISRDSASGDWTVEIQE